MQSFTTFQASPVEPTAAPLSSDQPAKALLRHAERDTAPARPSAGSWHLYSQHGKTKHYWNPISCSLGRCAGKGKVWPKFCWFGNATSHRLQQAPCAPDKQHPYRLEDPTNLLHTWNILFSSPSLSPVIMAPQKMNPNDLQYQLIFLSLWQYQWLFLDAASGHTLICWNISAAPGLSLLL